MQFLFTVIISILCFAAHIEGEVAQSCSLQVIGDGSYNCSVKANFVKRTTTCGVTCGQIYQGQFTCPKDGKFTPDLPYCARQKGYCTVNEEYKKCGTYCQPTCENQNPKFCPSACVDGCFCIDGYVRNYTNGCVKKDECPKMGSCDLRIMDGYYSCNTDWRGMAKTICYIACGSEPERMYLCENGKFQSPLPDCARQVELSADALSEWNKSTPSPTPPRGILF